MSSPNATEAEHVGPRLNFATLDHLAGGLVLFNSQHEVLALNSQAENLLGRTGKNSPKELRQIVQETFSTRQAIQNRQIMPDLPGKNVHTVVVNTFLLSTPGVGGEQVLALLNPASESEKLRQRLEQLNRLSGIGTLSASLAHEIKNALVPLRTYFELRNNPQDELTEIANQGLRRVESLVSQLLKYGRPAEPAAALLHVHQILENALRLIQFQLTCKMVVVERSFGAASDSVRGDAFQLEQAFSNIFINALEAMHAGGGLTVATQVVAADAEHPAARLQVRVSDTGAGIAPEDLPRLFDTFFTTKPSGTGLGLTITRRIIQEHGGSILAESAPKKGTTFTITFPLVA